MEHIKKVSGPVSITLLHSPANEHFITILGDYHDELPLCRPCDIKEGCYTVQELLEHLTNTFSGNSAVFLEMFSDQDPSRMPPRGITGQLDLTRIKAPIYKIDLRTPKILDFFIEWVRQQETTNALQIENLIGQETLDGTFNYLPKYTLSAVLDEDSLLDLVDLDSAGPAAALKSLMMNLDQDNEYLYYYAAVALYWIVDLNFITKVKESNTSMSIVFIGKAHADHYVEYYTNRGYVPLIQASSEYSKCISTV